MRVGRRSASFVPPVVGFAHREPGGVTLAGAPAARASPGMDDDQGPRRFNTLRVRSTYFADEVKSEAARSFLCVRAAKRRVGIGKRAVYYQVDLFQSPGGGWQLSEQATHD